MIDRTHELPVVRQCQILALSPSTAYSQPPPVPEEDLALRGRIDALHVEQPIAGAYMLSRLVKRASCLVGRQHVTPLMNQLGLLLGLYRKHNTNKRHPEHKRYSYLLRKLRLVRANQVWKVDINYSPMTRSFVNLFAVMDWVSRISDFPSNK